MEFSKCVNHATLRLCIWDTRGKDNIIPIHDYHVTGVDAHYTRIFDLFEDHAFAGDLFEDLQNFMTRFNLTKQ